MCNNNKIVNELKNFYNNQNMNMNFNLMNNIKNMNSNNLISNNNNVDNVTKIINDINYGIKDMDCFNISLPRFGS